MKKRGAFDIEWKFQKFEPPPKDSYAARHLPFGRLTEYGRKKLEEESHDQSGTH